MIRFVIALGLSFSLVYVSLPELIQSGTRSRQQVEDESLYLPNGDGLNFISFGYRNALSDLLWFKTISYFGKHYATDKNYRWLEHMCDLVTTLDPHAAPVYQFCANMLSWEAHTPDSSIRLLSKAIQSEPTNWKYPYLRGFTYLFFLKDNARAKDDLVAASHLPDVHPMVIRLAAKSLAEQESPQTAIDFLATALATERDPYARRVLLERLEEAKKVARAKAGNQ